MTCAVCREPLTPTDALKTPRGSMHAACAFGMTALLAIAGGRRAVLAQRFTKKEKTR